MNIEKIRRLLLLTIVVMIFTMGWYIWRHNTKDRTIVEPIKEVNIGQTKADVVVTDIELTETSGERILWTLQAKTAEVYTSKKQTRLKDIAVDFFDKNGDKSMHLISDLGIKDDKTGNIIASGNVQATSYKEGATLKTSELVYNAQTQLITSDKHVVIEDEYTITSGDGLESNLSLSEVNILRNISILEK